MHRTTRPRILRAEKFGGQQSYECDCACPEHASPLSPHHEHIPHLSDGLILRQAPGYCGVVNDHYRVALSQYQRHGAIVLNDAAHAIFKSFEQATPIGLARVKHAFNDFDSSVQEFIDCGLLISDTVAYAASLPKLEVLSAWLHVTNACNIRCDYCYLKKTNHAMNQEVGEAAIDAVFRSATANEYTSVKIKYAGGEASLNFPLVLHLHDYAQRLAAKSNIRLEEVILTNGIRWTHEMIAACKTHNIRAMISLDGLGKFHDDQRHYANGAGSVDSVIGTIETFCDAEFPPHLSITLSERNLDGLPDVVAWILQRQLTFSINFYRENNQSTSFRDLQFQETHIIDMMKKAFHIIEENLPPYSLLGLLLDRTNLASPHHTACSAGHSYLVIDQNGGVAKCQMEIDRPVATVWEHDPLKILRAAEAGLKNFSVEEKEGCRECEWKYWCAGGCPIQTFRYTGRYDVKSPNCNIYKSLFPEILRLEGLRILKYASPS